MARLSAAERMSRGEPGARRGRVRIEEECLELDAASAQEATRLRSWIGWVNGTAYAQPFLIEGPPGRFRLYVGTAAERVRTARGIV